MSLLAHQPGLGLGSAFAKIHQPALFSDVETDGNIFLAAAVLLDAAGLQYVLSRVFGPDKASKKQQIRAACQPLMDEFGGLQFDVLETEAAIIDQQKDVDKVLEKDTNLKLRYLAEKASHGSPKDYSFYGGNGATLALARLRASVDCVGLWGRLGTANWHAASVLRKPGEIPPITMGLEFRDGVTRCNPQNRPIPTPSDMAAIDARNAVRFQGLLRAVESRVCEGRLVLVAILEHHFAAYVDRPENRQLLKEVGLAASRLKVGCEVEKYDTFLKRLAKDQHSLAGEKKELKFGNHSRYDQAEAGSVDGQIVKDNGSITVHTSLPIVDSAPSRANWRRRHEALPLVERLDVEVEYPGPLEKTFTIRPGVNVVIYIGTCIAFYWTHIVTVIKRFKGPISIVIVEEVRKEISRQASWVQGASRRAKRILGQQILAPRSLLPPQKVIQYSNTGTRIVDVKGDLRICHEISLDIQARQAASTEALVCLVLSLDCGFGPTFDGIGPQTADVRIPFLSQYPQSPYHWISNDKSSQGLQGLRPGGFLPAIHYMLRDVLVR